MVYAKLNLYFLVSVGVVPTPSPEGTLIEAPPKIEGPNWVVVWCPGHSSLFNNFLPISPFTRKTFGDIVTIPCNFFSFHSSL